MSSEVIQQCFWDTFYMDIPTFWDCPPLTMQMVEQAEKLLQYKLPRIYLDALQVRNGGMLRSNRYNRYLPFQNGYLGMNVLFGIGGENGIDSNINGVTQSQFMIRQWGYPDTGVVISHFGHAGFLLDYSVCGPQGEPSLVYVYSEAYPHIEITQVSPDLETFFSQLEFEDDESSS